jgi:hypothetical protein
MDAQSVNSIDESNIFLLKRLSTSEELDTSKSIEELKSTTLL